MPPRPHPIMQVLPASVDRPPTFEPTADPSLVGNVGPPLARGPLSVAEALLKSPATLVAELRGGPGMLLRLLVVGGASLLVVGLVAATFSGGLQVVFVPLKLVSGVLLAALICLPSLHIFSCLAGATQRFRETLGALLMGIALMGLLLLGFAPIAWIFSQTTSSVAVMGAIEVAFLAFSTLVGLGLVRRSLVALNQNKMRGLGAWSVLFMVVLFQMTTTLRPLVGPDDGMVVHERLFFLTHWIRTAIGS
jgi:hypothetical protein